MKITMTIEDTPKGVTVNWTEAESSVSNHPMDSIAVILAADFLIRLNTQHRLGTLRLSGEALRTP